MAKSKNGLTAVGLSVLAAVLIMLAFTTKNWMVTDGELERPRFERIGLWVVCFKQLQDSHHWFDTNFNSCRWVFDEEYYILYDILFKGFYIATQFWFTACVLLTVFGLFYTSFYMYLHRSDKRYVQILFIAGLFYISAAACSSIALIIFGLNGDIRIWMPNWEHNDIGWSYGVAVAGTIALYVSGILYVIEGRVHKLKGQKLNSHDLNDLKQSTSHTEV